jgi:hypothetical protein
MGPDFGTQRCMGGKPGEMPIFRTSTEIVVKSPISILVLPLEDEMILRSFHCETHPLFQSLQQEGFGKTVASTEILEARLDRAGIIP